MREDRLDVVIKESSFPALLGLGAIAARLIWNNSETALALQTVLLAAVVLFPFPSLASPVAASPPSAAAGILLVLYSEKQVSASSQRVSASSQRVPDSSQPVAAVLHLSPSPEHCIQQAELQTEPLHFRKARNNALLDRQGSVE